MEITVVGHKRVSIRPERGTLHLRAGFESADKDEALSRTTDLVGTLSRRFQTWHAAPEAPITWYAVLPITTGSWRPHSQAGAVLPLRHLAAAAIRVKFRDFAALAQFGQQFGGSSGITMEHVEWALTEATRENLAAEVLGRAVEDARARALVLARAAGARDVQPAAIADPGLLSGIGDGPLGGPGFHSGVAMRGALAHPQGGSSEGIDLAPEDVVVEASVHVRFLAT